MMFVATRRDRRDDAAMPTAGRQLRSSGPPMRTSGNREMVASQTAKSSALDRGAFDLLLGPVDDMFKRREETST